MSNKNVKKKLYDPEEVVNEAIKKDKGKEKIYTHDEAANIIQLFEDVLSKYNISVPSDEDDDRNEEDMIGLYGSTYSDLLDSVEERIYELLSEHKENTELIPYVFTSTM